MNDELLPADRRQIWDRVASGWAASSDATEAQQRVASDWLVTHANLQPGHVVLELAAGAGGLGRRISGLVGPDGRVISTDFADEMVEVARQLGSGLDNIEYRSLDAEEMTLDDDSVGAVICRSGFMIMADPGSAFGESKRVLQPGGTLAFSVFTTPSANPWATLGMRPFVEQNLVPPPEPGAPGMFALGDQSRVEALLHEAGFESIDIEIVNYDYVFDDDDAVWRLVSEVNARLAPLIQSFNDERKSEIRRAVLNEYAPFKQDDGAYRLPAGVVCASAQ